MRIQKRKKSPLGKKWCQKVCCAFFVIIIKLKCISCPCSDLNPSLNTFFLGGGAIKPKLFGIQH